MRVLVVDSNEASFDALRSLLCEAGYDVERTGDGRDAIEMVGSGRFHLVLTEWDPSGLDAPGLCRAIRSTVRRGYIFTIVLSDRTDRESVAEALAAGADDCVCKPYHAPELLLRLRKAERIIGMGSQHAAVLAMAKLAESRDTDTGQHLERMRAYSWILARDMANDFAEITEDFVDTLYQTSVLHDIGKVGIPDFILLKPDRLTDRELEIMRRHTLIGAETLAATAREFPEIAFFRMATDIARSHHENFDGSGYPAGLAGHDIPLSARIVAVADVYDALTTRRPYKSAYDHEVSKSIILDRQRHFDPSVLRAFLAAEAQLIAIRDSFSDHAAATA
jgi:putative two-component system response regulator